MFPVRSESQLFPAGRILIVTNGACYVEVISGGASIRVSSTRPWYCWQPRIEVKHDNILVAYPPYLGRPRKNISVRNSDPAIAIGEGGYANSGYDLGDYSRAVQHMLDERSLRVGNPWARVKITIEAPRDTRVNLITFS